MITGELKSKVDKLWDAFWSGGISNPLEVIEQITYLLFIRRLDDLHTLQEKKANRLGGKIENSIFPLTKEGDKLRWSRFKNFSPQDMFDIVSTKVFPFMKDLRGGVEHSTYSHHMKDARFTIPTPGLLAKVVELVDDIPMDDRDTKGDVYEYMLGKIATAGQNGQFRTPRHIIKMMVDLVAPKPKDIICDPACGTAGFLVAAGEYLQLNHTEMRTDQKLLKHFHEKMFNGFDFDNTMLRIASMNMLLHGVENPNIIYKDSLSEDHIGEEECYTLILANPPFAGSLDYESCADDLLHIVKTKKTELLFVALFLRMLKPGGRAAIVVPDGVLFGSSNAHKNLRRTIVDDHKLEAIVSMPAGVFRPYSGVSTAVLLFTKTGSGGTDKVWFYDMHADGYSLDDKRSELDLASHENNNIPDVVRRWKDHENEAKRLRTEQSFFVPKKEIIATGYDLNIHRYQAAALAPQKAKPIYELLQQVSEIKLNLDSQLSQLLKESFTDGAVSTSTVEGLDDVIVDTRNGISRRRKELANEGTIVLRIRDVGAGYIDYSEPNRIALSKEEVEAFSLKAGDVLLVRVNGNPDLVGRAALFTDIGEIVAFNDHLIRVRVNEKRIDAEYLVYLLNSPLGRQKLRACVTTTAGQFTINRSGIASVRLPIPSRPVQKEIVRLTRIVKDVETTLNTSQSVLNELLVALIEPSTTDSADSSIPVAVSV